MGVTPLSATDIAWAAGLFEGEGTIVVGARPHYLRIALVMTDRDVVERFAGLFGGRVTTWHPPRLQARGWSQQWYWNASGQRAADVLRLLAPELGRRRLARLAEVLEVFDAHVELVTGERVCPACKQAFRPAYSSTAAAQVFCSKACSNKARDRRKAG